MSTTAADLTGAYRADAIPGYILSRPTLQSYASAEDHFRRAYLVMLGDGLRDAGVPAAVYESVMRKVADDLRLFALGFGTLEFDAWATAPTNGELLTWLSLLVKHEKITMKDVQGFYANGNGDAIYEVTLELWGYRTRNSPPPDPKNAESQGTDARSPGSNSLNDSAPQSPPASGTPTPTPQV